MKGLIRNFRVGCAVVVCLLFVGCGGEYSSVSPSTELGDMSEGDVAIYCSDEATYLNDRIGDAEFQQMVCIDSALSKSESADDDGDDAAGVCQEEFDSCLAKDWGEMGGEPFSDQEPCTVREDTTCELRIADLEACVSARVEAKLDAMSAFSCGGEDWGFDEEDLPSCQLFQEECPDLYGYWGIGAMVSR